MKTAREMIEVMQAFVDGKTIEVYNFDRWLIIIDPRWTWGIKNYRIKTEPQEFFIGIKCNSNVKPRVLHSEEQKKTYEDDENLKVIKVVEVLP